MTTLEDNILSLLSRESGLKGREIAQRLRVEKTAINSALFKLKSKQLARQDGAYRWFLTQPGETPIRQPQQNNDTPLARLCRYYLHCLSLDDESGVSLFAKSNYTPDYVELPVLPDFDPEGRTLTSFPGVSELFRRLRGGTNRQVPFLGYPVRLRRHRSESGWEGFFVEPVFLFEFNDDTLQSEKEVSLTGELPILNFGILRSLALGDGTQVMDEAARLTEELGFSEAEPPELDDLMARLVEIRADWDWKEEMNPATLSLGLPLAAISEVGIYNRAIVFGCERSPYTKGLERELVKLQSVPEDTYRHTALGAWLRRDFTEVHSLSEKVEPLLEPIPLNSEQREAVEKALVRPLTVITGPPGTGKSQVVSSLLINAAKRGIRVLFASKNNKAVDVVEARVNALGPRPVLLRLGRGAYQSSLAQYLTALLASRTCEEDSVNYKDAEQEYSRLLKKIGEIQKKSHQIVESRNVVDAVEQGVETIRKEIGPEYFRRFGGLNSDEMAKNASRLHQSVVNASRNLQPFLAKLAWFAVRKNRLESLRSAAKEIEAQLVIAGINVPPEAHNDNDVAQWQTAAEQLLKTVEKVRAVSDYTKKLRFLIEGDRIEDLTHELAKSANELGQNSIRIWEAWLRLAPSRMSPQDRQTLGDFCAVLRLIANCDEQKQSAGREVFARYYRLFPKLVNLLPCWAVTSLSASGRIPLDPAFFNILVIDEASQCDIASLLPLLYRAKAAVIIGDPMQLRHISSITSHRDRDLLQQHGLAQTHESWAFSVNSVFDLASPLAAADEIIMLRDHHRSHADIINFSNEHFYEGRLRVATNYDRLRRLSQNAPVVRWIHVEGQVTRSDSSVLNEQEAKAIIQEIERMIISQGYRGTIGVVTPFRPQANRIRDILHRHPKANFLLGQGEILIDTVHRFQGDERDVMFFSPVVSGGMSDGTKSFLRKTGNLFNVAITRARAALVVVGNISAAKNSDIKHLAAFANYVESLAMKPQNLQAFTGAISDGGPIYPAVARPELVSDWERLFYCELYSAGLRPIPQFDVEKFTLDFALIAGGRRLDIEVDGERYHRDWNGELLRRDQLRNMRLIELGWDVMRFWVYEIRDTMPECIARVKQWLDRSSN